MDLPNPPTLHRPWKAVVEPLGRGLAHGSHARLVRARCGGKNSTAGLQSLAAIPFALWLAQQPFAI